jgi:integrase/recombinase XerC
MIGVYLFYMVNTIDVPWLSTKGEKVFSHTVNAYLNDIRSFQSFNETHFAQETIEDVNYSQIRSWIVALVMEVCLMFPLIEK